MKRTLATWGALLALAAPAPAQVYDFMDQVNEFNTHSLGVNLANDGWFLVPALNRDDGYTNGVDLSFGGLMSNHFVDQMLDQVMKDQFYQKSYYVNVAQKMYTPEDKTATAVIANDRPYAGYMNLGFYLNGKRINDKDQVLEFNWSTWTWKPTARTAIVYDSLGVQFGALGDAGAPWAQGLVHGLAQIEESRGWQNHLPTQLTFQLSYHSTQRTRLFGLLSYPDDASWYYIAAYARHTAELGNAFIRLTQGFNLKLGWFLNEPIRSQTNGETGDVTPVSEATPPLFFSPLSISTNIVYNVYDATISAGDQSMYHIASVPVVLNAQYGSETRFPFGIGAFLYLKLIWLETTTSSYVRYRDNGTVNYDDWLKNKQIVKLGFDYSF